MKVRPLDFEKPIVDLERQLEELKKHSKLQGVDLENEVAAMERKKSEGLGTGAGSQA
jgi:acetyl-CoA carboxylase carboxyl transferase subunit alpha